MCWQLTLDILTLDWQRPSGLRQVSGGLALLSMGAGNVSEPIGRLHLKKKRMWMLSVSKCIVIHLY